MSRPLRFVRDLLPLYLREVRYSLRIRAYLIMSIVQPILWLVLFGQLFGAVGRLPEFDDASYLAFLTPGLAVMTASWSSAYAGMGVIRDLDRGIFDRLLATPVSRTALIGARGLHSATVVVLQALIVLGTAFALGVRPPGGLGGVAAVLAAAALLGAGFGGASTGLALVVRKEETMIALTNFLVLPLLFLSSLLITRDLMPEWMARMAAFNPVDWAVTFGRAGFRGEGWSAYGAQLAALTLFAAGCWLLAGRSFARFRKRE